MAFFFGGFLFFQIAQMVKKIRPEARGVARQLHKGITQRCQLGVTRSVAAYPGIALHRPAGLTGLGRWMGQADGATRDKHFAQVKPRTACFAFHHQQPGFGSA